MNKIIVIYTFSPFPSGDANANRIYAMALSMENAGYKVIVLTNTLPNEEDFNVEDGKYIFNNIEYRSYYKRGLSRLGKIKNKYDIKKIIESNLKPFEREKIYLICSSYKNYNFFLHYYLKRLRIPALVDSTEWYSSFQFKYGKINLKYIVHDFTNRYLLPKAKNIICISKYLQNYYNSKGCNTIYLPPQIVIKDYQPHIFQVQSPIVFFYGGSIQKDDPIGIALEGFTMLDQEEKEKIKIIIAGCDEDLLKQQLTNGNEIIENLGDTLSVVGRISKKEVQQFLSKAHFMFLLRRKARYSTAGFPSKVPESLASGVPVILNLTSDLEKYIFELKNGLIVKNFSALEFSLTVRKAINLSEHKLKEMSDGAYSSALSDFEYSKYNSKMANYLNNSLS